MKTFIQMVAAAALVNSLQLSALPFTGTEITIFDGSSKDQDWHRAAEDGEVEPGMQHGQKWDLEGMWLQSDAKLAIVGGYNFMDGEAGFDAGDIFVDIDGDNIAINGQGGISGGTTGNTQVINEDTTFGYEYVFDIDWQNKTYDLIELTEDSYLLEAWYKSNYSSSPWRYDGELEASPIIRASGSFDYVAGLSSAEAGGYAGVNHNVAYNFDLSWFVDNGIDDAYFHNTMGCGNDNLMGHAQKITTRVQVPEPSSVALLVLGMIGLGMLRRKP